MELRRDTSEQMFVCPIQPLASPKSNDVPKPRTVFVPPISGVGLNEPRYANPETVNAFLAQFKAGDVLRNLLVQASESQEAWDAIQSSVKRLFGYELVIPEARGAFIVCDYIEKPNGPKYDIASAGSGFQQVLMLLCFLHTRPGTVLLLDEPDSHLHVILQDAVYAELRKVAAMKNAQLVIATHSEVIINATDLSELRVSFEPSRPLLSEADRKSLSLGLRHLSNLDVMQAQRAPGVLYFEDYTDLLILREWARILDHPVSKVLSPDLFWKKVVIDSGTGIDPVQAKDHYEALRLVRKDLPGLLLVDGDARPQIGQTDIEGKGLQRLRWIRYEIESYLLHPASLARFVEAQTGTATAREHLAALHAHIEAQFPRVFQENPFADNPMLRNVKARTDLLPQLLSAAGLPGFPYTRYHEIASVMKPEEIHPEVREKLNLICKAFGVAT
jgi:hypothetical protein